MLSILQEIWQLILEMSVYLLFGFLVAGLLKYYISDRYIKKIAGKGNLASDIKLSLFGIPLPLCSCGVIPTGISLFKSGASKSSTTAFFISTPQTGVDSIAVTYSLINLPFALIRPIVAFLSGILGGFFVRLFTKYDKKSTTSVLTEVKPKVAQGKISFSDSMRYAFIEFFDDISKWLSIGILLAAIISVAIPAGFFSNYIENQFLQMILILIASIPLYVCATGSVPIAAALMLKGLSPGAALVFLMAGPATNMATITIIKKVLGIKTLAAYLLSISLGAITSGVIINNFFPADWFSLINHHSTHQHQLLPIWLEFISAIIFLMLLFASFYRKFYAKYLKKQKKINPQNKFDMSKINVSSLKPEFQPNTIIVEGMTCNHCKANVENALKSINGISNVEINLENGHVKLDGSNYSFSEIEISINELGYSYKGLINN
jgi:uncharacterized membrane protein YraQ (UPF0718 family)/copper chaperone CopZ